MDEIHSENPGEKKGKVMQTETVKVSLNLLAAPIICGHANSITIDNLGMVRATTKLSLS